MIQLQKLASALNNGLNANGKGLLFYIQPDTGDFKTADRTGNDVAEYINGILSVVDSAVIPTQALEVAAQTVRLELVVETDEDEPAALQIGVVRDVLQDYFARATVQYLEDETGKVYSVAVSSSLLASGTAAIRQLAGDSFTLSMQIYYSFIQNGINSLDCPILLDGVVLPYSTATISRVPVVEGAPYSDTNAVTKNRVTATALGVDMSITAVQAGEGANANAAMQALYSFILDGAADKHTLTLTIDRETREYPVYFGNVSLALDGVKNAGSTLSFVEAVEFGEAENGEIYDNVSE